MRSTSVLTKKPIRSSSAASVRPAIGLPIGMSVPAPAASAAPQAPACSTMNRRRPLLPRQRHQAAVQLRHRCAARRWPPRWLGHRRPRPVGRQFRAARAAPPASRVQNASCRAIALVGVALLAQHLALPQRVVGVLHRQRRQARHAARRSAPRRPPPGRAHSGPSDQPSPAMWCSSSSSTCSRSPKREQHAPAAAARGDKIEAAPRRRRDSAAPGPPRRLG